ncbi:MAG: hypothetical protein B1H09_08485 [Gemmatimonadaceae bacterium 4484_173]|jgi:hypothetical protein|nr:MAG: hypothetical protein B1H09_08485 [Gemmatimonadaceae bacterium 4484_173]
MSIYKQANELSMALSSLLRKMKESMGEVEGVPVENREEYSQFQSLLTTSVFLQRDLDEFLDKAMTVGDQDREGPVEVLDFSNEWERFE